MVYESLVITGSLRSLVTITHSIAHKGEMMNLPTNEDSVITADVELVISGGLLVEEVLIVVEEASIVVDVTTTPVPD